MQVGCVILAAGNAARFGENKLLALWQGKPLIQWTLDAVPAALSPVAVVTRFPAVEALAAARGLVTLPNERPELGISHSVALGTAALAERCAGILFLAADQPCLRPETLAALAERFRAEPDRIVAAAAGERRGNPAVFPASLFPALQALRGDRGGMQLIRRFPELVVGLPVDPAELADVDTAADLRRLPEKIR